jgi:hypothetical protein
MGITDTRSTAWRYTNSDVAVDEDSDRAGGADEAPHAVLAQQEPRVDGGVAESADALHDTAHDDPRLVAHGDSLITQCLMFSQLYGMHVPPKLYVIVIAVCVTVSSRACAQSGLSWS